MKILGLDPSLTNYGWCLLEYDMMDLFPKIKKGRIQTNTKKDFVSRYPYIRDSLVDIINKYNPDYIGIETPIFKEISSEAMYALYIYSCEAIQKTKKDIVMIDNNQTKSFVTRYLNRPPKWKSKKEDLIEAAKKKTNITKWTSDEADAFWIAYLAERFWSYYLQKITVDDLNEYEKSLFLKIKKYTKGKRKGEIDKVGIFYRENDKYFFWSKDK